MSDIVVTPDGLTSQWLSEALGRPVTVARVERVGTGQIGSCFRVTLEDGDRLLAKLPAADPAMRPLLVGAYAAEVRFYTEIAATVDVATPALRYAAIRPGAGDFTLLLEDLTPWEPGDQITGCSADQALDAVLNLARLHGPRWCDARLPQIEGLSINTPEDAALMAEFYGPATDIFLQALGDQLAAEDHTVLRECVDASRAWALARADRFGLVHGDYRLDNLLFPADGSRGVATVDWQTLSLALPARDLAYVVATSLDRESRRRHERALVAAYHAELATYRVGGYSAADCWDDYCFAMLQGPIVAVFGCAYGKRTERGDTMFTSMTRRSCAAIRDLGTLSII
jgi:Phosphotransferase enzyme family